VPASARASSGAGGGTIIERQSPRLSEPAITFGRLGHLSQPVRPTVTPTIRAALAVECTSFGELLGIGAGDAASAA
jgi:hypothetical protein